VDARVVFSEGGARAGDLVRVRIRRASAHDLVGQILETVSPAPPRLAMLPSLGRTAAAGDA